MLALERAGHISIGDVITRLTWNPAKILKMKAGALTPGFPADVVLFDPMMKWSVEATDLKTKSPNTPLLGMTLQGRAVQTFVEGEVRYCG
jgi:dihydroorotase